MIVKIAAVLCVLALFFYWENNALTVTHFTYTSAKLPKSFDGFVVVHLSDLHNKRFGAGQKRLLDAIAAQQPDLICITGDSVDRRRMELAPALELMRGACAIAPVYVVSGNHEAWSGAAEDLLAAFAAAGAHVLDDDSADITRNGESITLLGLRDPAFENGEGKLTDTGPLRARLEAWTAAEGFKLLLSHRPELMELYAQSGVDMALAGHAHGGQFRLPGVGGLYAPHQGLFPRYTEGGYTLQNTTMYVSRGLGNSVFPLRLFDRPEIVVITLKTT